jgi:Na+-driven multidrug efflux pump
MALSAARVLYVYLPLAWLGQWIWGLQGIFVATALANICIAIWGWCWLRRYIAGLPGNQHLRP